MPSTTPDALSRLGSAGRRMTAARSRVISAVARRKEPFTAQELVLDVARAGVGRATVFRTLDVLVSIGMLSRVHGIEQGARCLRYTRCAPSHHHHLICRSCGRVDEVDLVGLDAKLARVAQSRGYAALEHTIEIAGICASCRAARP